MNICRTSLFLFILFTLSTTTQAHPPTGIVADKSGNIYFTDLETVWKLDSKGTLKSFRSGVSGRHVHELSIDKDGNLYGADLSYESQQWISDAWKMTPVGQLSYLLAPTSNPPRGFSIWIDPSGNMYFCEQDNNTKKQTLLLRRAVDGTVATLAGSSYGQLDGTGTNARFGSVGGMVFGPDASLYLTDGTSVRRVTMDGVVTTVARDLTKRTSEDRPMLFGRNDVLEVGFQPPSTWLTPRVRKISVDGKKMVVAVAGEKTESREDNPTPVQPRLQSRPGFKAATAVVVFGLILVVWGVSRKLRKY